MFQYVIPLSINWAVNSSFFLFTNAEKYSGHLDLSPPGALAGCIGGDKKPSIVPPDKSDLKCKSP